MRTSIAPTCTPEDTSHWQWLMYALQLLISLLLTYCTSLGTHCPLSSLCHVSINSVHSLNQVWNIHTSKVVHSLSPNEQSLLSKARCYWAFHNRNSHHSVTHLWQRNQVALTGAFLQVAVLEAANTSLSISAMIADPMAVWSPVHWVWQGHGTPMSSNLLISVVAH